MSEDQAKYIVNIHGNAYHLAVGDGAVVNTGGISEQSVFMVPSLPPQGVFGRDETITRIFDELAIAQLDVTNTPPLALRGLGGIGKTTLATAFSRLPPVARHLSDGVLWVSVGPNPTIRLLLESWGRALGLDLLAERDEIACQQRLQAALHHRRMLLVVDDVWEVAHGQSFLVGGPNCRTLFTTRESPVAYTLATKDRTLRVDVLSAKAALLLLQQLAPDAVLADEAGAKNLCARLEFLPLAITLAGRLLAIESDVPNRMQRLLGELLERRQSRLSLRQDEGRPGLGEDGEPVSLQAILGMSVDRLDATDQDRFAMLSVFGGDPLTWEINAVAHVWECSVEDAEATVSRFIRRGLVEPRGNRYWMHALLADYATEMMEDRDL